MIPQFNPLSSFYPLSLFANGEPGFWLDPSDLSTMFQTSAGTTPVTAVEQPVGRINDKSGRGCNFTQSTAGVRPVLSARVNGFLQTETFGSSWTKSGATISTAAFTAPNGTLTGCKLIPSAASGQHYATMQPSASALTSYTLSIVATAMGQNWLALYQSGTNNSTAYFNLSTGVVGTTNNCTSNITALGGGLYLCKMVFTAGAAATYAACEIHSSLNGSSLSYTGDGVNGIGIWGADLRPSDQATGLIPTYQRVNTSTDYDTAGFPLYLSGNGTQWMQCAAQDYTGVNKIMLCGGVRKKSDAALAVVFELSPTIASNNGAVLLSAPNSAAANLNFSSKGTTQVDNVVTTYTSPNTTVLTGLGDISAPSNIVRVNGAQVGSVSSTQGTGNYGNYAGFLFARNGASSMLTGNIYQLIARGSTVASNAAQIANTESWTDLKTKAY